MVQTGSQAVQVPRQRPRGSWPSSFRGLRRQQSLNWFAICAITVLVASDYKFQVRSAQATLSGQVDVGVFFEIGCYVVVAAYLIVKHARVPKAGRLAGPMLAATVYLAIMLIALIQTPHPKTELVRAFEMITILALVGAVVHDGSREHIHRFAHGFLILVTLSVFSGVLLRMPRVADQQNRFTWLRIYPVTSSVYTAVAVVLAVAYLAAYRQPRPGPKWPAGVYVGFLVVATGGLIASQTRGAIGGAAVGVLTLFWLLRRGARRVEFVIITIIGLALVAVTALPTIIRYLERGETSQQLASFNNRTSLWTVAWHDVQQKPLYGWGLGASHSIFLDATGLGGAHNAFVNVTVDLGVVGLIVWLWLIISTTSQALQTRTHLLGDRGERATIIALMALLLVNGFSNGGLGDESNISATLLLILAGWSVLLRRDLQSRWLTRPIS